MDLIHSLRRTSLECDRTPTRHLYHDIYTSCISCYCAWDSLRTCSSRKTTLLWLNSQEQDRSFPPSIILFRISSYIEDEEGDIDYLNKSEALSRFVKCVSVRYPLRKLSINLPPQIQCDKPTWIWIEELADYRSSTYIPRSSSTSEEEEPQIWNLEDILSDHTSYFYLEDLQFCRCIQNRYSERQDSRGKLFFPKLV